MKYPELSCNVYAEVDGENVLLIEIDREGRAKVYHENLRIDGVQKIFEEINCNLREQCISKHILILLLPFFHFGLDLRNKIK